MNTPGHAPAAPALPASDSQRRRSLVGPLVRWELVRLARRGHATRARVIFIYTLLLALVGFAFWVTFQASPMRLFRGASEPLSIGRAADLARSIALVLLETQLILVAVLTPAYAAATLAEEKDRHTLPLLLTTELTDAEIVWGKVIARVLFVLVAVLAGAPVLMITVLYGGVDLRFLAAGYALTAGTAVLAAAVGANAACHSPDTRTALVRAYALGAVLLGILPPFVLVSPFAMLVYVGLDRSSPTLALVCGFGYPIGQLALAVALLRDASRSLRRAGATAGPIDRTAYPEPPRGRPSPVVPGGRDAEPPELPPIDERDPVLWKERHTGRGRVIPLLDFPTRWLGGIFALLAVMLFVSGAWTLITRVFRAFDREVIGRVATRESAPPDLGGTLMTSASAIAAGIYLLPLAVGVAGVVAGERQRGTLDPLMATLLRRRSMLHSKVRAHVESGAVFGLGALAAAGCGLGADGGLRLGLLVMIALLAAFALVVALGAWLSTRCATPERAFRLVLPVVLGAAALPVLVRNSIDWTNLAPTVELLAWIAGGCTLAAGVFWWRAGAVMERGG